MATQPGIVLLVQQMFDLAKYGLSGCYKLKSLTVIFGDSKSTRDHAGSRSLPDWPIWSLSALRFLRRRKSLKLKYKWNCYLRGRLNREEVEVTGSEQRGFGTGLCLDIKCEDGDSGLFFVTYTDGELPYQRNGFVRKGPELDFVMKTLRCLENPRLGQRLAHRLTAGPRRRIRSARRDPADPLAEPTCQMSLATARQYLGPLLHPFRVRPEARVPGGKDFVMRQLIKTRRSNPKVLSSFMYGKEAPECARMTLQQRTPQLSVSIFSLMWLARCPLKRFMEYS
uniref:SH2 domain-containing protein n=1 Tax=Macrostomum lignano TaxID=282301 RepID=A0A1I8F9B0_9PLAT